MREVVKLLRERSLNPRVCRFFGWSAFFMAVIFVVLYVMAGQVDVPEESPLSDPSYKLHELNDITVERGTELPPGTITPVNQLNNGEPVVTFELVFMLAFYAIMVIGSLFAEGAVNGSMLLIFGQCSIMKAVVETLVNIPFAYTHLRLMAQPLIDGSHRLRVAFAYIQLECERSDLNMASRAVVAWCVSIMLASYLLAGAIEFVRWRNEVEGA